MTVNPDGTYDVQADPAKVSTTLNALATKINRKAVNATFLISKKNKVVGVVRRQGRPHARRGRLGHPDPGPPRPAGQPATATTAPLTPAVATSRANPVDGGRHQRGPPDAGDLELDDLLRAGPP